MSDLLTHEEYVALASSLDLPKSPFIDGKYRRGTGLMMATHNPAKGEEITKISTATNVEMDVAVAKAREAFDQGPWSKQHPVERKGALIRLCKRMTRNRLGLAVMESLDSGKPIRDCDLIDNPEAIL